MDPWRPIDAIPTITYTLSLIGISWYALSFPSKINRHAILLCITLSAWASFVSSQHLVPDTAAEDTFLRSVIMFTAHIWFLITSQRKVTSHKIAFNPQATLSSSPPSMWNRGYKLLFNYRGIGTSWEIPHLRHQIRDVPAQAADKKTDEPVFSSSPTSLKNGKKTGRLQEVIRRSSMLFLRFAILCLWYELHDPASHFLVASDSTPEKEVLLRRLLGIYPKGSAVTRRELAIRAWVIIANHVQDYFKISALHDICAIIFIGIGLDEGWEWPPIFGSITEAYSARRYWSRFWHAVIYKSFSAHATAALQWIGVRNHSLRTRFLKNWIVFAMSAVMHGLVDWKLYPRCAYSRSLFWWLMQPMAFILESVVSHYWRGSLTRRRQPRSRAIAIFERIVGYSWVFTWMLWSVPKRAYPLMRCGG